MDDTSDETSPLMQAHQIQASLEQPVNVHQVEYVPVEEPPPYTSYEEKNGKNNEPPPYYHARPQTPTPSEASSGGSSLVPHINCRVCQTILSVEGKLHLHVIKCHSCGEATPIRPAPTGKKYVRCPCNCLLICKSTSQRIVCPRPNCKRVISLGSINITSFTGDFDETRTRNPTRRIICAHCNTSFLWVQPGDTYDRCPHCNRHSSFGPGYRKRKIKLFTILSLMIFVLGIVVMTTLILYHAKNPISIVWYGFFIALYFISVILFAFAIRYSCMSVSIIERPHLQYT